MISTIDEIAGIVKARIDGRIEPVKREHAPAASRWVIRVSSNACIAASQYQRCPLFVNDPATPGGEFVNVQFAGAYGPEKSASAFGAARRTAALAAIGARPNFGYRI
jgi:hypothetical protein